jgi:hypothetical protein
MPNSKLKDNIFKVPDKVFNAINQSIKLISVNNEHTKGFKRANDIVSDRKVTYSQMKRLKNYFDSYKGDGNDDEYKLIGGKTTQLWVDKTLGQNRDSIKQSKKIKMDGGLENQFIKTHEKDNDNANPTNPNGGMIDITKGSTLRNVMTGDAIYKSSNNKNEVYNKEIDSIKYLIEYMTKNKNN